MRNNEVGDLRVTVRYDSGNYIVIYVLIHVCFLFVLFLFIYIAIMCLWQNERTLLVVICNFFYLAMCVQLELVKYSPLILCINGQKVCIILQTGVAVRYNCCSFENGFA